ncbi:MAG: hypothetical protein KFB95_02075 [Simkaniaceae bacterium]|nr:MAG: hypothetical protein KFB95_02075 [Simkaniaceae bacterium]
MSDLTISMEINGKATLQLSISELEEIPGKFAVIASLVQDAVLEKVDLSSIQFFDPKGKSISIKDPMEYGVAEEALNYIKSEFSRAIHVEGRIIVRLNSPR